jgi:hypothetical protein
VGGERDRDLRKTGHDQFGRDFRQPQGLADMSRGTVVQGLGGIGWGVVLVATSRWMRGRPEVELYTPRPWGRHLFTINEGIGWVLIVVGIVTVVVGLVR